MPAPRFDITLDGNKFRLIRSEGNAPYDKGWERREIIEQQVRLANRLVLSSRGDRSLLHQTSWAGGSTWWEPVFAPDNADMYYDADGFDAFTTPGSLLASNKATNVSGSLLGSSPLFTDGSGLYAIASTQNQDSTYYDVLKFDGANLAEQSSYSSGVDDTDIHGVGYHADSGYVYVMSGSHVARFIPGGAQNSNWQALSPAGDAGDTLFITNLGKIFIYHAGVIKELVTSGPSLSDVVDDGFGPDLLASIATPTTHHFRTTDIKLAVASSNGVFYAKNTMADGLPVCYLSRVHRNAAGVYIREPLTTLPPGLVCVALTVHMGSVVMACTRDWQMVLTNDRSTGEYPRIDLYAWTEGGGLSILGSPDRDAPSELPAKFLGADSDYLYIGSDKRVWVYDAARGGIHPWLNSTDLTSGIYDGVAPVVLSGGDQALLLKRGTAAEYRKTHTDDPTTVTNFGDDLTSYVLTSNYFDYGLPTEDKTLMSVAALSESLDTNQQFTIQVSVDDGAYSTVLSHTNATFSEADISGSALTGKRFRYRVIYETKNANIKELRAISFGAATGIMVPFWNLVLSGDEIRNVENQVVHPETVFDNLETTAAKATPITLVDNFRSQRVEDTTTHTVLIQSLRVIKESPNESIALVSLVGVS